MAWEGYDNWKRDYPKHYDYDESNWCDRCNAVIDTDDMFEPACTCDPTDFTCEGCGSELIECIADETTYCEDCLCTYEHMGDGECEGCIYCLCCSGYDEAKAEGTLKTEPTK